MPSSPNADHLDIRPSESLKPYTTFKIGGPARYFADICGERDLAAALGFTRSRTLNLFILGGGSNVLISDAGFDGLVLHPAQAGIEVSSEDAGTVAVRVNAAEVWDDVVACTVEHNWWGVENLSHIPGQAGAALVQNIGAYGQQLSDVFESAEVMDLRSGGVKVLDPHDCQLAYRASIFNRADRGRFFILRLTLRLSREPRPNLQYADVKAYFAETGAAEPGQREIRQAIIEIRDRKFPFPRQERGGNAGSFFKNRTLNRAEYARLEARVRSGFGPGELSRLEGFKNRFGSGDEVRIPTAFLMEVCGLNGLELGRAKVNQTQPLVLLNLGGATSRDVMELARHVRQTVYRGTGVEISLEPELVGFTPDEVRDYLALE